MLIAHPLPCTLSSRIFSLTKLSATSDEELYDLVGSFTNINVLMDDSIHKVAKNIAYHLQNIDAMETSKELDLQQSRCS